jgi:hypothetical protein
LLFPALTLAVALACSDSAQENSEDNATPTPSPSQVTWTAGESVLDLCRRVGTSHLRIQEPKTGVGFMCFEGQTRVCSFEGATETCATLVDDSQRTKAAPPSVSSDEEVTELCARIDTASEWLFQPTDPGELLNPYTFRCYAGEALRCHMGATGAACMPVSDEEPELLAGYCRDHPDEAEPPFAFIWRGPSRIIWSCSGGQPASTPNARFNPADYDEAGFHIRSWEPVPSPTQ